MALPYFPKPHPGELLYSILARFRRHMGLRSAHAMEVLFGNRLIAATFDLPNNLQALSDHIGEEGDFAAERVLQLMTLFPYFTAFEPVEVRERVRLSMIGAGEGRHAVAGITAFRVGQIPAMRFCPDCLSDMKGLYGEIYWRRDHQLPSVIVCPEHGVILRNSRLLFHRVGRHDFVAADAQVCPTDAAPVADLRPGPALDRAHRLAIASADLLEAPPQTRDFAELTHIYRDRLAAVGLMRSPMKVDQRRFAAEFLEYYGDSLQYLPSIVDERGFCGDWLAGMVRTHRKAHHPLYHLLLRIFLDEKPEVPRALERGPWPCHNPLADHFGLDAATTLKQHRNRDTTVGVYSCDCGYVYTRGLDRAGQLGPPRYQEFGPLLEPALRDLVRSGTSLRATGRALHLDPKTVMREAASLGIEVPWSAASSGKPRKVREPTPKLQSSAKPKTEGPRKPRKDWADIDASLARQCQLHARSIAAQLPPVRVSIAELERRIGHRNWISRRRSRLPITINVIRRVVEDRAAFQRRRIRWAISSLMCESSIPLRWEVMKLAGVTSQVLPIIDELLLQARRHQAPRAIAA